MLHSIVNKIEKRFVFLFSKTFVNKKFKQIKIFEIFHLLVLYSFLYSLNKKSKILYFFEDLNCENSKQSTTSKTDKLKFQ